MFEFHFNINNFGSGAHTVVDERRNKFCVWKKINQLRLQHINYLHFSRERKTPIFYFFSHLDFFSFVPILIEWIHFKVIYWFCGNFLNKSWFSNLLADNFEVVEMEWMICWWCAQWKCVIICIIWINLLWFLN